MTAGDQHVAEAMNRIVTAFISEPDEAAAFPRKVATEALAEVDSCELVLKFAGMTLALLTASARDLGVSSGEVWQAYLAAFNRPDVSND